MTLSLLLWPVALLLAATPFTEKYWYSIAWEDGTPIGYGYTEIVGPLDEMSQTNYRQLVLRKRGEPAVRVTDRIVIKWNGHDVVSIAERIDRGSDWIEARATLQKGEAIVTRTTPRGQEVRRIALPLGARVFAYDMFAPSRCVPPTKIDALPPMYELDIAEMALDRLIVDDMRDFDKDGDRAAPRRRLRGDKLSATETMNYDGDCHLTSVVKPAFGVVVRIKPVDRETALKVGADAR